MSFHQSGMLNAKKFFMSLLSYLTMKKVSRMRKLALNALFVILNFVIAEKFIQIYSTDVSDELVNELKDLKSIHVPNFGTQPLSPIELFNRIYKSKLQSLFPNGCIALSHCD